MTPMPKEGNDPDDKAPFPWYEGSDAVRRLLPRTFGEELAWLITLVLQRAPYFELPQTTLTPTLVWGRVREMHDQLYEDAGLCERVFMDRREAFRAGSVFAAEL